MTIRLELSHRICRNVMQVAGSKGLATTYCQKTLTKLDKQGNPAHDGPCSIHPDPPEAKK